MPVLLAFLCSPASADPPVVEYAEAGCQWDMGAESYLWYVTAWVSDADGDLERVAFRVIDRDDDVRAGGDLEFVYDDYAWSVWYTDFHEVEGGPTCPDTYRVSIGAFDAEGGFGDLDFFIREIED
jgi:hypothetical protein